MFTPAANDKLLENLRKHRELVIHQRRAGSDWDRLECLLSMYMRLFHDLTTYAGHKQQKHDQVCDAPHANHNGMIRDSKDAPDHMLLMLDSKFVGSNILSYNIKPAGGVTPSSDTSTSPIPANEHFIKHLEQMLIQTCHTFRKFPAQNIAYFLLFLETSFMFVEFKRDGLPVDRIIGDELSRVEIHNELKRCMNLVTCPSSLFDGIALSEEFKNTLKYVEEHSETGVRFPKFFVSGDGVIERGAVSSIEAEFA